MKILKFQADWCQPCQTLSRLLENVKPRFPDIEFASIDVDENSEMAHTYNIRSLPTLVLINQGREVKRRAGCPTEQELIEFCQHA